MNSLKKQNYSIASLEAALKAIKAGEISLRKASEKYGIPRSTLHDKLKEKQPECMGTCGPKTILNPLEEEKIVSWIKNLKIYPLFSVSDNNYQSVRQSVR